MWERFKRMVKSQAGRLADGLGSSDPLKADLKELERELPRLQKALAELRGEVAVLEDRERKTTRREAELTALVDAASARDQTGEARARYAAELDAVRAERALAQKQLAVAREALTRAEAARAGFLERLDRKRVEVSERQKILAELEAEDARETAARGPGVFTELHEPAAPSPGAADIAPVQTRPAPAAPRPAEVDGKTIGLEATPTSGVSASPRAKTIGLQEAPTGAIRVQPAASQAAGAGNAKTIGPAAPAPPSSAPLIAAEPPARPLEKLQIKVRAIEPGTRAPEPAPAAAPVVQEPPPAPVAPEAATSGRDVVGELERLAKLHAAGVLTPDELAAAKKKLLGSL